MIQISAASNFQFIPANSHLKKRGKTKNLWRLNGGYSYVKVHVEWMEKNSLEKLYFKSAQRKSIQLIEFIDNERFLKIYPLFAALEF